MLQIRRELGLEKKNYDMVQTLYIKIWSSEVR